MIHLVTGGSGSGKSVYAEQCILDFGGTRRVYIATMQPFGAEGQARIARHRKMRAAKKFSTIECYTNLKEVELEPGSDVLLECMSNLTANEIFDRYRLHTHHISFYQRINIHTDSHKTQFHLSCCQTGTSGSAHEHTLRLIQISADPCNLRLIHQTVSLIQKFLIRIQDHSRITGNGFLLFYKCLFILIDEFSVSAISAFLRKSG